MMLSRDLGHDISEGHKGYVIKSLEFIGRGWIIM